MLPLGYVASEVHSCKKKHRNESPEGIFLLIIPMTIQIMPAGTIHIAPAGIENIPMSIEILTTAHGYAYYAHI